MTVFVQPTTLIIAGPRDVPSVEADELVSKAMANFNLQPALILEGGAHGIDRAARRFAVKH